MFIPLVVLSQVKQPCLLPAISFCLANVTKRDFLAGMHLLPDQLPRTEACQKTTSLTEMQLCFATKLCTATASFSGTQSTVHDACSLYTQPVRKRLHLSPILLQHPNPHKDHMYVVSTQTSFCGGPSDPTRGNPKPKNLLQALFTACARKKNPNLPLLGTLLQIIPMKSCTLKLPYYMLQGIEYQLHML